MKEKTVDKLLGGIGDLLIEVTLTIILIPIYISMGIGFLAMAWNINPMLAIEERYSLLLGLVIAAIITDLIIRAALVYLGRLVMDKNSLLELKPARQMEQTQDAG